MLPRAWGSYSALSCELVPALFPLDANSLTGAQRHGADIEQYASWLGMDLELDSHLFWIARAGLMTELPEDWKPCKSPDGEVYYFNFASGESQWDHPCDEEFRELYREQRQASILAAQGFRLGFRWYRLL